MKLRIRKLISLIAFAALISASACKQEKSPPDGQSSARSIGGGADQMALAEAIILLFIARKQARDTGECVQGERPLDRRSSEDRMLKRLLCDPLARQEAKHPWSEPEVRL